MRKSSSGRSKDGSEVSSRTDRRKEAIDRSEPSREKAGSTTTTPSKRRSRHEDQDRGESQSTPAGYSSSSRPSHVDTAASYMDAPSTSGSNAPEVIRNESMRDEPQKEGQRDRRRDSQRSRRSRAMDEEDDDIKNVDESGTGAGGLRGDRRSEQSTRADITNHNASLPQNQFPDEFPDSFTSPYRPPGFGLAADYYGDHGESVAAQPGVRPVQPSVVVGADAAYLQEASTEAKPPPEPSSLGHVGAAASYYGSDDTPQQPAAQTTSVRPNLGTGNRSGNGSMPRVSPGPAGRPSRPSGPAPLSGPSTAGTAAAAAGVGLAADYFSGAYMASDTHPQAQSQVNSQSHSQYQTPTQQGRLSQSYYGNSSMHSQHATPQAQMSSGPNYAVAAAAGITGAGLGAYYAGQHSHHGETAENSFQQTSYGAQGQDTYPQLQQRRRTKRRGPIGRFVDWFRDPEGVAEFEEYSRITGVCKYCFDPNSTAADAPRQHHYHDHKPPYQGGRYGSSTRVDKVYRKSSDEQLRRRSSTKKLAAAAVAGAGAAKVGEAMYKRRNDFDNTYSIKSGKPINDGRVGFREDEETHSELRKSKQTSGIIVRDDSGSLQRQSHRTDEHRKRWSRRRDSSASSDNKVRGAALSTAAGAAATVLAAGAIEERRRKSRSRSRSPRRRNYYSKRVSPRHSYVDLAETSSGPLGLGSFFSSPSANQEKGKKKKGLFTFQNASSSSSDADLAFGQGTVRRKPSRRTMRGDDKRHKVNDGGETAAILGLAATGAALAAESARRERKGKEDRNADYFSGKTSRLMKANKIALQDREPQLGAHDGDWEDLPSEPDSIASVDMNLAYGGRSARQSRESLVSDQGTSKWDWRWNKRRERDKETTRRRGDAVPDPSLNQQDPFVSGAVAAGVSAAGVTFAASHLPSSSSTPHNYPLQYVDPRPMSESPAISRQTSASNQFASTTGSHPTVVTASPLVLQQPQPITPVASMPYETSYQAGSSRRMLSGPPATSVLDRIESSARISESPKQLDSVEPLQESRARKRRDSSPSILPSQLSRNSVAFELTEEQLEAERRAKAKEERRRLRREERGELTDEQYAKEKEERRRQRREERERRKSEPTTSAGDPPSVVDPPTNKGIRSSSTIDEADAKAKREAEIEQELHRLYEEEKRLKKERKRERRKDRESASHDEAKDLAGAMVAAGGGAALASIVADKAERAKEEDESQPRPRSVLKKTKEREISPDETQQERTARIHVQRARSTPSPVHEEYSSFFMPLELKEHVKEHNEAAEHRDDIAAQVVEIVPGETASRPKFDPFTYRLFGTHPDDDPLLYPWPVPFLELIEPTPPNSRPASRNWDRDNTASEVEPANAEDVSHNDEDEVTAEPIQRTRSGSRVSFGDHDTWVYEVLTPEEERQDFTTEDLARVQTLPDDNDEQETTSRVQTLEDLPRSKQEVPPVEEMSAKQREHLSLGRDFADLPPSDATTSTGNGGGDDIVEGEAVEGVYIDTEEQSPAIEVDLEDLLSGQKSFYQSPFAETVEDLGNVGSEVPKTGHGFIEDEEVPETPADDRREPLIDQSAERSAKDFSSAEIASEARPSKSERRRLERAASSVDDVRPRTESSTSLPGIDDVPKPQDVESVFDYLVDERGRAVPPASALGVFATHVPSHEVTYADRPDDSGITAQIHPSSESEIFTPEREGNLDGAESDSVLSKPRSTTKSRDKSRPDYASDTEDWERSSSKSKSKDRKKSSSKSDLGSSAEMAIAGFVAAGAAAATANVVDDEFYEQEKSHRRRSKSAGGNRGNVDDTSSVVSKAESVKDEDEKRKKRSKRDSEIFDDDDNRSVKSDSADSRKKSKDKKSTGGFFSSLLSGNKSDISTSNKKSSKAVKSEARGEKDQAEDTEKRRKKRSSKDKDFDDAMSITSEPVRESQRESLPPAEQGQPEPGRRNLSLDGDFASADEPTRDYQTHQNDDSKQSFLAGRPEMPRPTAIAIPTGSDGASGLTTESVPVPDMTEYSRDGDEHDVPKPHTLDSFEHVHQEGRTAADQYRFSSFDTPTGERSMAGVADSPLQARSTRLSAIQTSGIASSPIATSSPTAVPLHFGRRFPVSPIVPGALSDPPSASPSTPLTATRTRQNRPKSTEFRSGKEFRPLYLVEHSNPAKVTSPQPEDESLPSLPSSKSSSAHPSMENLRAEVESPSRPDYFNTQRITPEMFKQEGRRHSYAYWHDEADRPASPDFLDSRSATPVPGETQKERELSVKKELKYEFHSPSELLQDPTKHRDVIEEDRETRPSSPLPSIVSTDQEQEFVDARSRSQLLSLSRDEEDRQRSRSGSRSQSRIRSGSIAAVALGTATGLALGGLPIAAVALGTATGLTLGAPVDNVVHDTAEEATPQSRFEDHVMAEDEPVAHRAEEDDRALPTTKSKKDKKKKRRTLVDEDATNAPELVGSTSVDLAPSVPGTFEMPVPVEEPGSSLQSASGTAQQPDQVEVAIERIDGLVQEEENTSHSSSKSKKDKKKKRRTVDFEDLPPSTALPGFAEDDREPLPATTPEAVSFTEEPETLLPPTADKTQPQAEEARTAEEDQVTTETDKQLPETEVLSRSSSKSKKDKKKEKKRRDFAWEESELAIDPDRGPSQITPDSMIVAEEPVPNPVPEVVVAPAQQAFVPIDETQEAVRDLDAEQQVQQDDEWDVPSKKSKKAKKSKRKTTDFADFTEGATAVSALAVDQDENKEADESADTVQGMRADKSDLQDDTANLESVEQPKTIPEVSEPVVEVVVPGAFETAEDPAYEEAWALPAKKPKKSKKKQSREADDSNAIPDTVEDVDLSARDTASQLELMSMEEGTNLPDPTDGPAFTENTGVLPGVPALHFEDELGHTFVPTMDQAEPEDNELDAFGEAFERAVSARGISDNSSREEALEALLPSHDHASLNAHDDSFTVADVIGEGSSAVAPEVSPAVELPLTQPEIVRAEAVEEKPDPFAVASGSQPEEEVHLEDAQRDLGATVDPTAPEATYQDVNEDAWLPPSKKEKKKSKKSKSIFTLDEPELQQDEALESQSGDVSQAPLLENDVTPVGKKEKKSKKDKKKQTLDWTEDIVIPTAAAITTAAATGIAAVSDLLTGNAKTEQEIAAKPASHEEEDAQPRDAATVQVEPMEAHQVPVQTSEEKADEELFTPSSKKSSKKDKKKKSKSVAFDWDEPASAAAEELAPAEAVQDDFVEHDRPAPSGTADAVGTEVRDLPQNDQILESLAEPKPGDDFYSPTPKKSSKKEKKKKSKSSTFDWDEPVEAIQDGDKEQDRLAESGAAALVDSEVRDLPQSDQIFESLSEPKPEDDFYSPTPKKSSKKDKKKKDKLSTFEWDEPTPTTTEEQVIPGITQEPEVTVPEEETPQAPGSEADLPRKLSKKEKRKSKSVTFDWNEPNDRSTEQNEEEPVNQEEKDSFTEPNVASSDLVEPIVADLVVDEARLPEPAQSELTKHESSQNDTLGNEPASSGWFAKARSYIPGLGKQTTAEKTDTPEPEQEQIIPTLSEPDYSGQQEELAEAQDRFIDHPSRPAPVSCVTAPEGELYVERADQFGSLQEYHEEQSHQDWLARAHDKVAEFPTRPVDVTANAVDTTVTDVGAFVHPNSAKTDRAVAEAISQEPVLEDVVPEEDDAAAFTWSSGKKSKKDKKSKKRQSTILEPSEPSTPAADDPRDIEPFSAPAPAMIDAKEETAIDFDGPILDREEVFATPIEEGKGQTEDDFGLFAGLKKSKKDKKKKRASSAFDFSEPSTPAVDPRDLESTETSKPDDILVSNGVEQGVPVLPTDLDLSSFVEEPAAIEHQEDSFDQPASSKKSKKDKKKKRTSTAFDFSEPSTPAIDSRDLEAVSAIEPVDVIAGVAAAEAGGEATAVLASKDTAPTLVDEPKALQQEEDYFTLPVSGKKSKKDKKKRTSTFDFEEATPLTEESREVGPVVHSSAPMGEQDADQFETPAETRYDLIEPTKKNKKDKKKKSASTFDLDETPATLEAVDEPTPLERDSALVAVPEPEEVEATVPEDDEWAAPVKKSKKDKKKRASTFALDELEPTTQEADPEPVPHASLDAAMQPEDEPHPPTQQDDYWDMPTKKSKKDKKKRSSATATRDASPVEELREPVEPTQVEARLFAPNEELEDFAANILNVPGESGKQPELMSGTDAPNPEAVVEGAVEPTSAQPDADELVLKSKMSKKDKKKRKSEFDVEVPETVESGVDRGLEGTANEDTPEYIAEEPIAESHAEAPGFGTPPQFEEDELSFMPRKSKKDKKKKPSSLNWEEPPEEEPFADEPRDLVMPQDVPLPPTTAEETMADQEIHAKPSLPETESEAVGRNNNPEAAVADTALREEEALFEPLVSEQEMHDQEAYKSTIAEHVQTANHDPEYYATREADDRYSLATGHLPGSFAESDQKDVEIENVGLQDMSNKPTAEAAPMPAHNNLEEVGALVTEQPTENAANEEEDEWAFSTKKSKKDKKKKRQQQDEYDQAITEAAAVAIPLVAAGIAAHAESVEAPEAYDETTRGLLEQERPSQLNEQTLNPAAIAQTEDIFREAENVGVTNLSTPGEIVEDEWAVPTKKSKKDKKKKRQSTFDDFGEEPVVSEVATPLEEAQPIARDVDDKFDVAMADDPVAKLVQDDEWGAPTEKPKKEKKKKRQTTFDEFAEEPTTISTEPTERVQEPFAYDGGETIDTLKRDAADNDVVYEEFATSAKNTKKDKKKKKRESAYDDFPETPVQQEAASGEASTEPFAQLVEPTPDNDMYGEQPTQDQEDAWAGPATKSKKENKKKRQSAFDDFTEEPVATEQPREMENNPAARDAEEMPDQPMYAGTPVQELQEEGWAAPEKKFKKDKKKKKIRQSTFDDISAEPSRSATPGIAESIEPATYFSGEKRDISMGGEPGQRQEQDNDWGSSSGQIKENIPKRLSVLDSIYAAPPKAEEPDMKESDNIVQIENEIPGAYAAEEPVMPEPETDELIIPAKKSKKDKKKRKTARDEDFEDAEAVEEFVPAQVEPEFENDFVIGATKDSTLAVTEVEPIARAVEDEPESYYNQKAASREIQEEGNWNAPAKKSKKDKKKRKSAIADVVDDAAFTEDVPRDVGHVTGIEDRMDVEPLPVNLRESGEVGAGPAFVEDSEPVRPVEPLQNASYGEVPGDSQDVGSNDNNFTPKKSRKSKKRQEPAFDEPEADSRLASPVEDVLPRITRDTALHAEPKNIGVGYNVVNQMQEPSTPVAEGWYKTERSTEPVVAEEDWYATPKKAKKDKKKRRSTAAWEESEPATSHPQKPFDEGRVPADHQTFEEPTAGEAYPEIVHVPTPPPAVPGGFGDEAEARGMSAQDDEHSDVSESTRERRRRRRSPQIGAGEEPADLPRDRALTPPQDHDDIMDTALGVAAGLGFSSSQRASARQEGHREEHSTPGESGWSFAALGPSHPNHANYINRDSGVVTDSPHLAHRHLEAVRDSGFVASPQTPHGFALDHSLNDKPEVALRPPRPQSPTSSSEDVRQKRRSRDIPPEFDHTRDVDILETPPHRRPSPVDPATKDRSSALFDSSPAMATSNRAPRSDTHNLTTIGHDLHRSPSVHGHHHNHEELRSSHHDHAQAHGSGFETSNGLTSRLLDRATSPKVDHSSFRPSSPPERSFEPTHPSLHTIHEDSVNVQASQPKRPARSERPYTPVRHERSSSDLGKAAIVGAAAVSMAALTGDPRDLPSPSRSLGRSKSRTSSLRNLRGNLTSPTQSEAGPSGPATDVSKSGKAAVTDRGMSDAYEGYGAYPGSPMSPERPPSVRKRQSMQQIRDLEARVEQLAGENRFLVEAKMNVERALEDTHYQHNRADFANEEAYKTAQEQLRERDEEIENLKEEVARLADKHETLRQEHEQRYSELQSEHDEAQIRWRDSTRELDDVRARHADLSTGMEDIVKHQVDSSLGEKDAEIQRLQQALEIARSKIRELQDELLTRGVDDVVEVHDEDYFDSACQSLCQHVQGWVLRFSKFSDTRICRTTNEVRDERVVERFDNAVLDGSDVDAYLGDRIRRRDVFMSVVMTMIWEYVFTRYLFGMDREQRQKLKQLEKNLSEVGSATAVHQWRAMTLTLLSKREAFKTQCDLDTEAVAIEIFTSLSKFLPPPQNLESQIMDSLRSVMNAATKLSIEMRTQKAEYIMLPPLQPEYDTNGDLLRKVYFNASLMNERSGETTSNEELQEQKAVVRMVLFPLVVKKGDDLGDGEDQIVVCPAQVLVTRPNDKVKRPRSSAAGRISSADSRGLRVESTHSLGAMSGIEQGNMI